MLDHRRARLFGVPRRTGHDLEDTPHRRPPRDDAQEGEADGAGGADGTAEGADPEADGTAEPEADGDADPEAAGEVLG
jgi:hypothetical protein